MSNVTRNIAAGPVVNPGSSCDSYRIVLRVDYAPDGRPVMFYTHKQYLLKASPEEDAHEEDIVSYGDWNYFVVRPEQDQQRVFLRALANFQKRTKKCAAEWPIVSLEEFDRFHAATQTDCKFILLARNAFEVMMRREWVPVMYRDKTFGVQDYHVRFPTGLGGQSWPDPFTALVEADRWYRENVEAQT